MYQDYLLQCVLPRRVGHGLALVVVVLDTEGDPGLTLGKNNMYVVVVFAGADAAAAAAAADAFATPSLLLLEKTKQATIKQHNKTQTKSVAVT